MDTGLANGDIYGEKFTKNNWKIENNPIKTSSKKNNLKLSDEEMSVLNYIKLDSLTIDELNIKTNLNINNLMVILTKLELEGLISQTHGEKYILVE